MMCACVYINCLCHLKLKKNHYKKAKEKKYYSNKKIMKQLRINTQIRITNYAFSTGKRKKEKIRIYVLKKRDNTKNFSTPISKKMMSFFQLSVLKT